MSLDDFEQISALLNKTVVVSLSQIIFRNVNNDPQCIALMVQKLEFAATALNAFHAAGECRRQVKNVTILKNVKIVEFHEYILNHREKFVQKSTNMPGIGLLIREDRR